MPQHPSRLTPLKLENQSPCHVFGVLRQVYHGEHSPLQRGCACHAIYTVCIISKPQLSESSPPTLHLGKSTALGGCLEAWDFTWKRFTDDSQSPHTAGGRCRKHCAERSTTQPDPRPSHMVWVVMRPGRDGHRQGRPQAPSPATLMLFLGAHSLANRHLVNICGNTARRTSPSCTLAI